MSVDDGYIVSVRDMFREILSSPEYSPCHKHPLAAIVRTLDGRYHKGVNGPPAGYYHPECIRADMPSGHGMEKCPTIHAEIKSIMGAAKSGSSTEKGIIYISEWFPCDNCAKLISAAGLTSLITPDDPYLDRDEGILVEYLQNQPYHFELAEKILVGTGVKIIVDPDIRP